MYSKKAPLKSGGLLLWLTDQSVFSAWNQISSGKAAFFGALGKLSGSGEEHITGAVERSLAGVLQDTDDEANANDLHGNIIADTEGCAGNGDQQQRTTGNTRGTAGADRSDDAEQQRRRQVNYDSHRMCTSQREDGNRDGRATHVDRSPQWN